MRRELIEAINIQAKRDGIYLPIIKAVVFEELSKKYKCKPLKELLSDSYGGSWGEEYVKNGLEAISLRSPDIRHGFIDFVNGKRRFYEKEKFKKFQLEDGDILVIKSNGSLDLVGKSQVFISKKNYPNVTASNFLMILKPNKDIISPLYLDSFLKSPQSLIWRVEKQRTTTGLRNLDSKGYLSLKIPFPDSKDEQNEIVDIINKLVIHEFPKNKILDISNIELASQISERFNELLNELKNQKKLLTKLKQSILQEAIQGKLTKEWREQNSNTEPASELLKRIKAEKAQLVKEKKIKKEKPLAPITKEEIPFELPESWVWCRMQESGLFERGKSKHRPRNDQRLFTKGTIPFIQTGEVARSKHNNYEINNCSTYYNDFGLAQSRLWKKGTMCITIAANIAQTGFLNIDACFPDSVVGFTALSENSISKYIRFFIDLTKTDIEKFAPATAQKNINLGIINLLRLPLPPEKEIIEIVKKVDTLMQQCQALEQEIQTSETNAKMLMQAVLKEAFESKENKPIKM
jgi:type I restriction enzyme S subunit